MDKMINVIRKSEKTFIEEFGFSPDTIRMHPEDALKLRDALKEFIFGQITSVLGLKILEDKDIHPGQALIYNRKFEVEIRR